MPVYWRFRLPMLSLDSNYQRERLRNQKSSYDIRPLVLITRNHSRLFGPQATKQIFDQILKPKTVDSAMAELIECSFNEAGLKIRMKAGCGPGRSYFQALSNFIQEIGCGSRCTLNLHARDQCRLRIRPGDWLFGVEPIYRPAIC